MTFNFYDSRRISSIKIHRVILKPRGYGKISAIIEKETRTMEAIEIIEKHLKEAWEKQAAAYKKWLEDSSSHNWNEFNSLLSVCSAIRGLYYDVLENEIKRIREQLKQYERR